MGYLPDSQREVLTMLKVLGMTVDEVARATSSTGGAVKQKAHRAYEKLRAVLENWQATGSHFPSGGAKDQPSRSKGGCMKPPGARSYEIGQHLNFVVPAAALSPEEQLHLSQCLVCQALYNAQSAPRRTRV